MIYENEWPQAHASGSELPDQDELKAFLRGGDLVRFGSLVPAKTWIGGRRESYEWQ